MKAWNVGSLRCFKTARHSDDALALAELVTVSLAGKNVSFPLLLSSFAVSLALFQRGPVIDLLQFPLVLRQGQGLTDKRFSAYPISLTK